MGHPGTRGGHPGTRIGPSWDAYGPVWDVCGPVWVAYGPAWVACGPAWDACGPAWVAYGPTGPGNVLHACDVTLRAPPTNVFGPAPESRENQFLGRRRSSAFCRGAFTACLFFKIKLKRERQRDTTRLRLTWESLDSQPASLRLNSPKFCGRGKRAGLGSAAAVLPRNSSPTEALDPSFHARDEPKLLLQALNPNSYAEKP